jgi:hypothetical protein
MNTFMPTPGRGLERRIKQGWTGLLANLVMRRYRKDIPEFWTRQAVTENAASRGRLELQVA